jgi:catechol 2,3-dioxygenase-like lactoylglutathione lyase family enzyme
MSVLAKDRHLRLHSVDVFVRNQERSLRFYCQQLGFELAFDAELHSGRRWIAVAPPHGTALLTLIQPEPNSPEYKMIGRATRVVFVTEDVIATFAEWSARGVRFRHTPKLRRIKYDRRLGGHAPDASLRHGDESPVWGEIFTRFQDIDGNSFTLVSFDEVSKAVAAQRRAEAERMEAERRTAQDLEIATQVQARLFPQGGPASRTLEYAGTCVQARQVGGDYYDFLDLGEGRLGLVIADIAGKGMPAALLMANLQANVRSQCAVASLHPEAFLESVNRRFCENTTPGAYATMLFAEYDDNRGRVRYVNCGHLPGLLLRADDRVDRLHSTCTVVGLFDEWECVLAECEMRCGDTLVLYTDGVTESFSESGEEFGEKRLVAAMRRHRELPPVEMTKAILTEVQSFSGGWVQMRAR